MIFFDERIADDFFDSVNERFIPGSHFKMQGYVGLKKNIKGLRQLSLKILGYGLPMCILGVILMNTLRLKWKESS